MCESGFKDVTVHPQLLLGFLSSLQDHYVSCDCLGEIFLLQKMPQVMYIVISHEPSRRIPKPTLICPRVFAQTPWTPKLLQPTDATRGWQCCHYGITQTRQGDQG